MPRNVWFDPPFHISGHIPKPQHLAGKRYGSAERHRGSCAVPRRAHTPLAQYQLCVLETLNHIGAAGAVTLSGCDDSPLLRAHVHSHSFTSCHRLAYCLLLSALHKIHTPSVPLPSNRFLKDAELFARITSYGVPTSYARAPTLD